MKNIMFNNFPKASFLAILFLLCFQPYSMQAAIIYTPIPKQIKHIKSNNKLTQRLQKNSKKQLRKKIKQQKAVFGGGSIIFLSLLLLVAGLVLGAIFGLPGLWITCLCILSLAALLCIAIYILISTSGDWC